MQIEYTQATTESFDGQASHEDILGNTAGGGEVVPPTEDKRLVSKITGADYGKTINYKATVQGQEVGNWKVFLNDGTNVYIILDDYLPVSLVPVSAGFTTNLAQKPYSVWSTSRDVLVSILTTQSYWSEFANGVEGATATGSPTNAQFVASWNANSAVNRRQLEVGKYYYGSTNGGAISDQTKMYIPHTERVANSCDGYWLTSPYMVSSDSVWCVGYDGSVGYNSYGDERLCVRPLVCLPSNLEGTVGEMVEIN